MDKIILQIITMMQEKLLQKKNNHQQFSGNKEKQKMTRFKVQLIKTLGVSNKLKDFI